MSLKYEPSSEPLHISKPYALILQEGFHAVAKSLLPVGVQFVGWLASSGIELVVLDTSLRVRVDELGHGCAVAQEVNPYVCRCVCVCVCVCARERECV